MQIAWLLIILPYYLEFHGMDRFRNLSKLALYKAELELECKYGNMAKKPPTSYRKPDKVLP